MTPDAIDLAPIKAAALRLRLPLSSIPLCSIGTPHQWVPEDVEPVLVALINAAPALVREVEALRALLRESRAELTTALSRGAKDLIVEIDAALPKENARGL